MSLSPPGGICPGEWRVETANELPQEVGSQQSWGQPLWRRIWPSDFG